jgi:tetratricopeptide (TPR) repeat protein
MRAVFCSLAILTASVCAQETTAPAPPADQPSPSEAHGTVSGADAAPVKPQAEPKLQRPSKAPGPSAAAFPTQYLLFVAEAMKSFQARDFEGALAYADRADALLPPSVWTLNVRGAVAIEQLKFADGEKYCVAALKMDPNFFPAQFNLCEIPFLQKNYAAARQGWQVLYSRTSPEDPTVELLVYRIFLTYLLEPNMHGAQEWLDKLPFPSQTPAYQYAHAAWERQNGNLTKWQEWIESAEFIWPNSKRASFSDVLFQLGWLKKNDFSQ